MKTVDALVPGTCSCAVFLVLDLKDETSTSEIALLLFSVILNLPLLQA